jgi:hypothetical protein
MHHFIPAAADDTALDTKHEVGNRCNRGSFTTPAAQEAAAVVGVRSLQPSSKNTRAQQLMGSTKTAVHAAKKSLLQRLKSALGKIFRAGSSSRTADKAGSSSCRTAYEADGSSSSSRMAARASRDVAKKGGSRNINGRGFREERSDRRNPRTLMRI